MSKRGQLGQDVCERPAPREASCRLVESQTQVARGPLRAEPWNQDTQPRRQFVPQFDVSRSYRGPRFPSSWRRPLLAPNRTHLSASPRPSFLGTNRPTKLFDCFHSLQRRLPSPHPAAPRPSPLPYADSRHFAGRTATPRQLLSSPQYSGNRSSRPAKRSTKSAQITPHEQENVTSRETPQKSAHGGVASLRHGHRGTPGITRPLKIPARRRPFGLRPPGGPRRPTPATGGVGAWSPRARGLRSPCRWSPRQAP